MTALNLLPPVEFDGAAAIPSKRLSELAIGRFGRALRHSMPLLLDDLSTSSDPRWLCCIGKQAVKPLLRPGNAGDRNRVLQIVAREEENLAALTCRALLSGQSHTVVLMCDELPDASVKAQLEQAAEQGDCECLIIQMG